MTEFDPKILLGQPESHTLEFKAAASLRRLGGIAREVVGLLNADGGDIWIGVRDQDGRAVAIEEIPRAEQELARIRDHLLDTIEPIVQLEDEVKLFVQGGIIHLAVQRGEDPPYAQREDGRRFLKRAGPRLREMSRQEIAEAFKQPLEREDRDRKMVEETIVRLLREQASEGASKEQLWLRLVPLPGMNLDFDDQETVQRFRTWLTDATATGNQPEDGASPLISPSPECATMRYDRSRPRSARPCRGRPSSRATARSRSRAGATPCTGKEMIAIRASCGR